MHWGDFWMKLKAQYILAQLVHLIRTGGIFCQDVPRLLAIQMFHCAIASLLNCSGSSKHVSGTFSTLCTVVQPNSCSGLRLTAAPKALAINCPPRHRPIAGLPDAKDNGVTSVFQFLTMGNSLHHSHSWCPP